MMGTLLVVPTEAKTGKFPPSWEGVPPAERSVCYRLIEKNIKTEKIKKKLKRKRGRVERDTKPKIETKKKVQTRNNKTQRETQAMLNGNERRDLWGAGKRRGRDRKVKVCVTTCVFVREGIKTIFKTTFIHL